MIKKHWYKHARKVHKWLGYLLALQVFFWLLGGLVMSAIPLDKVHGKHLASRQIENPFDMSAYRLSFETIKQAHPKSTKIEFTHRLDIPVVIIFDDVGKHVYHGQTAIPLTSMSEMHVKQLAVTHYLNDADIRRAVFHDKGPREIGYKEKIWQVEFDDWVSTSIYFDALSGQVITVRSTIWRIFDFFWMLHIMDYDEREDFNNPLLISFSAIAVLFCLSGILLLMQSVRFRARRKTV